MNENFQNFRAQVNGVLSYLSKELNYSSGTISKHNLEYRKIWKFMFENGHKNYSQYVGSKYLKYRYNGGSKDNVTKSSQYIGFGAIQKLNQFLTEGKITTIQWRKKEPLKFTGKVGLEIELFIEYLKDNKRAISTTTQYRRSLYNFMKYCNKEGLEDLSKIDLPFLLKYINDFKTDNKYGMISLISYLRGFLEYLFRSNKIKIDLSRRLPKPKVVKQPNKPSVYSEKEITQLLNSIDRAKKHGRRKYLIILLAVRLGLRASDISELKFENIDWDNNTISIFQCKTGNKLELPLLTDVGNALIDYLRFERPKKSNSAYVFLKARPPYNEKMNSCSVTGAVQKAIIKAGLRKENRKFGAHSLRHSLAQRMLNNKNSINIITEVLGHKDYESSKYYLRIDLASMRNCVLEVPVLDDSFFLQKEGFFYE